MRNSEFVLVNNDNQGTLTYAVRGDFRFDVEELYNTVRTIPNSKGTIGLWDFFLWLVFYNNHPCEVITTDEYIISVTRQGTTSVQRNDLWYSIEDDHEWHIIISVEKKNNASWTQQDNQWVTTILIPIL